MAAGRPPRLLLVWWALLAQLLLVVFLLVVPGGQAAGFRGPNGYPGQNTGQLTLGLLQEERVRSGAACLDGSAPGE